MERSRSNSRLFAEAYREGSRENNNYCRVLNGAFSMLEPCEVKVSRRVLRGRWGRKVPSLPDITGVFLVNIATMKV
jgi:hypothetical protein